MADRSLPPADAFAPLHVEPLPRVPLAPRFVRLLSTVMAVGALAAFVSAIDRHLDLVAIWFAIASLASAAYLLHVRHVGAQLIARGVWWSYLILGTAAALDDRGSPGTTFGMMGLLCGGALLLSNAHHVRDVAGRFTPRTFQQTLTVGLVLAVADFITLAFWSVLAMQEEPGLDWLPLTLCATAMGAAIFGLYRQRVWGVVWNVMANVVIAALAFAELLEMPDPMLVALVCTAVAQALLLAPVLLALIDGRAPRPTERTQRVGAWLTRAALVGMMAASMAGAFDVVRI